MCIDIGMGMGKAEIDQETRAGAEQGQLHASVFVRFPYQGAGQVQTTEYPPPPSKLSCASIYMLHRKKKREGVEGQVFSLTPFPPFLVSKLDQRHTRTLTGDGGGGGGRGPKKTTPKRIARNKKIQVVV
jgi:hypothetical protein